MKQKTTTEEDALYEPVEWKCSSCGKIRAYTDEELEKVQIPKPNTKPEDWDYYLPCPFCKKGSMLPPTLTLAEGLQSILDCDI